MKLYKDSERQQTIRNFLKMHGVTSLERMKSKKRLSHTWWQKY